MKNADDFHAKDAIVNCSSSFDAIFESVLSDFGLNNSEIEGDLFTHVDDFIENMIGFTSSDSADVNNRSHNRTSFSWYIKNIFSNEDLLANTTQHGFGLLLNVLYFFIYRALVVLNNEPMDRTAMHAVAVAVIQSCLVGDFDLLFDMII